VFECICSCEIIVRVEYEGIVDGVTEKNIHLRTERKNTIRMVEHNISTNCSSNIYTRIMR
jgi:hypothetical protein